MSEPKRSSDVVESFAEQAFMFGIGGLIAIFLGGVLIYYKGMLIGLGYLLMVVGIPSVLFAIWSATRVKEVTQVVVVCPYCSAKNTLLEQPNEGFPCAECNRQVPIFDGKVVSVSQVRCGFCNTLNYYNDQSAGLLCENCNREIPIATADGQLATKSFHTFAQQDDEKPYDLILTAEGPKHEEVVACLQHMLALNRNQVKQILEELPATLLSGIPRKKAELLSAQLSVHGAEASFSESATG